MQEEYKIINESNNSALEAFKKWLNRVKDWIKNIINTVISKIKDFIKKIKNTLLKNDPELDNKIREKDLKDIKAEMSLPIYIVYLLKTYGAYTGDCDFKGDKPDFDVDISFNIMTNILETDIELIEEKDNLAQENIEKFNSFYNNNESQIIYLSKINISGLLQMGKIISDKINSYNSKITNLDIKLKGLDRKLNMIEKDLDDNDDLQEIKEYVNTFRNTIISSISLFRGYISVFTSCQKYAIQIKNKIANS